MSFQRFSAAVTQTISEDERGGGTGINLAAEFVGP